MLATTVFAMSAEVFLGGRNEAAQFLQASGNPGLEEPNSRSSLCMASGCRRGSGRGSPAMPGGGGGCWPDRQHLPNVCQRRRSSHNHRPRVRRPQRHHRCGVPAEIVAANGHSATFIVPGDVQLGPTSATATNPGGHTGSIGFKVCDLRVPEAWGGEWEITTVYRKITTNSITATDDTTAFIRTDEPFGLGPAVKAGNCAGSVSDT